MSEIGSHVRFAAYSAWSLWILVGLATYQLPANQPNTCRMIGVFGAQILIGALLVYTTVAWAMGVP